MKWIYLFIAGALEITWAVTMKMSNGFSELIPSIITGVGYIVHFAVPIGH
jgi:quaternary ammonium compound-resistance protein SugE